MKDEVFQITVTREQLSVLGQKGHFDALLALLKEPNGLTYTELHYGALARKNTTNIMTNLMAEGLASKVGDRYVITETGRKVMPMAQQIVDIPAAPGSRRTDATS